MVTRVVAVKEGEGGKSDRDGDEGGGQRRGQRRQSCVYIFRRNFNTIRNFEKGLEFSNHLKLRRNHNLNAFARMDISFTRLCPQPSNPNTVWKLRLSAFCMCYYFLVSYW
jgi:hypothetical protein